MKESDEKWDLGKLQDWEPQQLTPALVPGSQAQIAAQARGDQWSPAVATRWEGGHVPGLRKGRASLCNGGHVWMLPPEWQGLG